MKGEDKEVTELTLQLQEIVFDYFNLIVKEYYMAQDKWSNDPIYVEELRAEYEKIDKEIEKDEMSEEVPEDLNEKMAR